MRTLVYVSLADDKQIVAFGMDRATGALRELSRVAVPGTDEASPSSMPLATSPDRAWLYAALRTVPYPICSFAIDPATGALTLRGTAHLPDSMCYLSTDPAGTRLVQRFLWRRQARRVGHYERDRRRHAAGDRDAAQGA